MDDERAMRTQRPLHEGQPLCLERRQHLHAGSTTSRARTRPMEELVAAFLPCPWDKNVRVHCCCALDSPESLPEEMEIRC